MKRKEKTESEPTAPAAPGRLYVPIDKVRPDPNQPRKVFDEVKLKELAQSIKEQGIIQDLLVTYCPPALRIREPDLTCKEWQVVNQKEEVEFAGNENNVHLYAGEHNLVDYYQIVDGERRWRAARVAGLVVVPVAVRVVEDKTKLALQVIANQQHENLSALEEAEAYRKEIESGRHTPETLYKSLGISRGTLFSRLALNKLTQPVRDALLKGNISVSVAGLAAMIPDVNKQEDFVEAVGPDEWGSGPKSFREALEELESHFCRQLKDAPFDLGTVYEGSFKITSSDGKPSPVTLHSYGTCKECRFRTGNMEVEFKNTNVCTEPKCFEAKAETAAAAIIAAAQSKGAKVLSTKESKKVFTNYSPTEPSYNSGYTKLNETCWDAPGRKSYKDLLGKDAPEPTLALNPTGKLIPVYSKEALREALKKKGVKLQTQGSTGDYAESQRKLKEKQKVLAAVAEKALAVLIERVKSEPLVKFLKLLALKACFNRDYLERHALQAKGRGSGSTKSLNQHLDKMNEAELRTAIAEAEWAGEPVAHWQAKFNDDFTAICEAYKVDLDKIQQAMKADAAKKIEKTQRAHMTQRQKVVK